MVQEIPSDIPEELYNLTQLAYVSYEAPKLSTDSRGSAAHEKDYLRHPHEPKTYSSVKRHSVPYYDSSARMINLSPADYYAPPSYHASLSHTDGGRILIVQEDRGSEKRAHGAEAYAPLAGLHCLSSTPGHAITMAEATKKKWTKKWEIIHGPTNAGGPPTEPLQPLEPVPYPAGRVEVFHGATDQMPTHLALSPDADGSRDSERSSLILYAPTTGCTTDKGSSVVAGGTECPIPGDKGKQMFTIIECRGLQQAVSCFGNGPQAAPPVGERTASRYAGTSASDESQDSAVVECYYSHKVFDRRKARKIRTASCTSTTSGGGQTTSSPGDDATSQDRTSTESGGSELDRSRDATNDSGHVEAEPGAGRGCNSSDENGPNPVFDVHVCPECNKRYSTSSNLARHRQTHRSLEDKKARKCPFCSKVYVSMPAYSMHVRTHNQGCECPTCGKCFSRPWLLQGHIRTHTGEKPFQCSVCNKAFADKSNLRAHVQTHSNTKPHACSRCGKSFALKSYLYKHEDSSCLKNERPAKTPKPAPVARTRRKVPKVRPATITSPPTERTISCSPPAPLPSGSSGTAISSVTLHTAQGSSDGRHHFPPNVPFKDVVRAKIREVVEDNCKKTARMLAAAAAACTANQPNGQPTQAPTVPDNRISVIRIASSTGAASPCAPSGGKIVGKVEPAPGVLEQPSQYPGNYAVIA